MIVGVGIDVVRFVVKVEVMPALRDQVFTLSERDRPPNSLAGRFAIEEVFAEALGVLLACTGWSCRW